MVVKTRLLKRLDQRLGDLGVLLNVLDRNAPIFPNPSQVFGKARPSGRRGLVGHSVIGGGSRQYKVPVSLEIYRDTRPSATDND
jgi:hypothetical protein